MPKLKYIIVFLWTLVLSPVNIFFWGKIKAVKTPVPHLVIRRKRGKWSWCHGLIINLSQKADKYTYFHEVTHLKQLMNSYGIMPLIYAYDYVVGLFKYKSFKTSYYMVRYEVEARDLTAVKRSEDHLKKQIRK